MLPTLKNGFSLIELLVVIGIIGVLTTIGVASYNRFNQSRSVSSAADTLINNLRYAQSNSRLGQKDGGVCAGDPLAGWQVILSPGSYILRGSCGASTFSSKTYTLPAGVTIAPATTFSFLPISGRTNLAADLTLTVSGFSKNLNIVVTKAGDISLTP